MESKEDKSGRLCPVDDSCLTMECLTVADSGVWRLTALSRNVSGPGQCRKSLEMDGDYPRMKVYNHPRMNDGRTKDHNRDSSQFSKETDGKSETSVESIGKDAGSAVSETLWNVKVSVKVSVPNVAGNATIDVIGKGDPVPKKVLLPDAKEDGEDICVPDKKAEKYVSLPDGKAVVEDVSLLSIKEVVENVSVPDAEEEMENIFVPVDEEAEEKSQFRMWKPGEQVSVSNLAAENKSQFRIWEPGIKVSVPRMEAVKEILVPKGLNFKSGSRKQVSVPDMETWRTSLSFEKGS